MHPLIRILCFIVFAGWAALGAAPQLWCALGLLAAGYGLFRSVPFGSAIKMIRRLRWFWLSLLILYGWFTPGRSLWPDAVLLASVSPSVEGLMAGAQRVAALLAIVLGVNLLLGTTSREQLLTAIFTLARPLSPFGRVRERLAVRMMLVIETLDGMRSLVAARVAAAGGALRGLRAAGALTSDLLIEVMRRADEGRAEVRLVTPEPVPFLQWCYPLLLWLGFFAAGLIR